jgi:hypothetical protein
MFESIVSGLLLAFISGSTFLAYKHPEVYRRMIMRVVPLAVGLAIGSLVVVLLGILTNSDAVATYAKEFPTRTLASLSNELSDIHMYTAGGLWGIAIGLALAAYLTFLWFFLVSAHKKNPDAG